MATEESATKKAKTAEKYHLIYWPGVPGRGEHVRLALEEAGADYTDTSKGVSEVTNLIKPSYSDKHGNPQPFAPPALKIGNTLLFQTSNILLFLGPRLGLAPDDDIGRCYVNELVLTALDLSDEAHNVHHPVGTGLYYEDQKDEALRSAKQFREERIPKFFSYFNRILKNNKASESEWLVGDSLTYADLVVFQVVDGVKYAFPKAAGREIEKQKLLSAHYKRVGERPRIKEYLSSERRHPYSMGIFRHYPELDE